MKISKLKWCIAAILAISLTTANSFAQDLKLWYENPAMDWTEGMPVGNGSLFGVALGDVYNETIQLNEETLWSGRGDINREKEGGAAYLDEVRRLLFGGKYVEGEKLAVEKMVGMTMQTGLNCYQTLGDLNLDFLYPQYSAKATNYYRELDLERAVVTIKYTIGDVNYTREIFSSAPEQAIFVKLSADKPKSLNFKLTLNRKGGKVSALGKNSISMKGVATSELDSKWGDMKYEAQLVADNKDGEIKMCKGGMFVNNCSEVVLKLVAATDYRADNPTTVCTSRLDDISKSSYSTILERHIADYSQYFDRVEMSLASKNTPLRETNYFHGFAEPQTMPTDIRQKALGMGGVSDPGMIALYFHFGRYIMISTSRPETTAINLWGKWVNSYIPSYDGDYHTNINIPMNYWPCEIANLSEFHTPYFNLIDSLRPNGRISARNTYGCNGFVAHFATDPWFYTSLVGNPPHGMWTLTSPWACHQMWEHYLYTLDKDYLREKLYPIMKETAEFYFDYLVKDPETGYYVTGPSTSPENRFLDNGVRTSSSMGPTADMQVMHSFFGDFIDACKTLNIDAQYQKRAEDIKKLLLPFPIGEDGRLQEWARPLIEEDPGHKHISHLYGVCESDVISPTKNPKVAAATLKSLECREEYGMTCTDEFRAITSWAASGYCRLYQAEKVNEILKYIIGVSSKTNLMASSNFGLTRRMYETDANLGATMVIAEMFLQSYEGFINILPALPKEILFGQIKGFKARGAFEIDMKWEDGALTELQIKSLAGQPCEIRYKDQIVKFETEKGKTYQFDKYLISKNL
ncbi:MAG: glycoside hydrolase family 95 protein [Rikenellaceae bacterium]